MQRFDIFDFGCTGGGRNAQTSLKLYDLISEQIQVSQSQNFVNCKLAY